MKAMGIEQKKLLIIQSIVDAADEMFIDNVLAAVFRNASKTQEAIHWDIPKHILEAMADRAETDIAAGNIISSAELLADLENW